MYNVALCEDEEIFSNVQEKTMTRWFRLCIYILTAILLVCGTVILFLRGAIPSPDDWSIIHKTDGDYYIRIESGEITAHSPILLPQFLFSRVFKCGRVK
jgi:hypothetical protein